MSNKAISVSLYRVSSDSYYLDTIIDCPENYNFTSFQLEVKQLVGGKYSSKKYDLSQACFPESTKGTTHFNFRLPIEAVQPGMGTYPNPAIYIADLKAVNEKDDADVLTARMAASDVNFAYRCMLEDVMNTGDRCHSLSDDTIRNYLLLYGHQAAMNVEDFETAEVYYKQIANCFTNCGADYRDSSNSCNCGK